MTVRIKTDKLLVSAYVRHGDTCSLDDDRLGCSGGHHDGLGCASGHKADDYVLVARFAYLQEGIDYCHEGARRGCRMYFVSRICKDALTWHYIPEGTVIELTPEGHVPGNVRMVKQSNVRTLHTDI